VDQPEEREEPERGERDASRTASREASAGPLAPRREGRAAEERSPQGDDAVDVHVVVVQNQLVDREHADRDRDGHPSEDRGVRGVGGRDGRARERDGEEEDLADEERRREAAVQRVRRHDGEVVADHEVQERGGRRQGDDHEGWPRQAREADEATHRDGEDGAHPERLCGVVRVVREAKRQAPGSVAGQGDRRGDCAGVHGGEQRETREDRGRRSSRGRSYPGFA